MSLINKMLQDLEARQEAAASSAQPVYQDLRPTRSVETERGRGWWIVVVVLAVGAALHFAAHRFSLYERALAALGDAKPETTAEVVPADPAPPAPESATVEAPKPVESLAKAIEVVRPPEALAPVVAPPPPEVTPVVVAPTAPPKPATRPRKNAVAKKAKVITPPVTDKPAPEEMGTVDKTPRLLTPEESAETAYRQAARQLEQGRADDALRSLREALAFQPKHAKARELAAGLLLQSGRVADAQKLLEDGLELAPGHSMFARLLARIYVEQGAEARAIAVMERAAPQAVEDADFSAFLGALYQRSGRHPEAVKAYEQALTRRPGDGRAWLGLAISLEGTGQPVRAVEAYERARRSGGMTEALTRYAEQRLAALKN